jgi:imidazolonepropionase-like amidohydrolase
MSLTARLAALTLAASIALAAQAASFEETILPAPAPASPAVRPFIKVTAPRIALTHVLLIDGTGGPAQPDRTVILENGKIAAITSADTPPPADATILDMSGHTVLPGLVGMHDHMYYIARPDLDAQGHSEPPLVVPEMLFSSPRLYLASGVTTLRTTGSVEPYTDLNLKRQIDAGALPGPHIDVTAPYLEGTNSPFIQMHQLKGPRTPKKRSPSGPTRARPRSRPI